MSNMGNPAMTAPSVQRLRSYRNAPKETDTIREDDTVTATDPSGGAERVLKPDKSDEYRQRLTKYDVGWRRIVRNFSPS